MKKIAKTCAGYAFSAALLLGGCAVWDAIRATVDCIHRDLNVHDMRPSSPDMAPTYHPQITGAPR